MLSVPFVFSMSHFQGSAFRCDKIVVIVTLLEAIEGIPDKDYFWGKRLLHERQLKSGYLERRIYERPKSELFIRTSRTTFTSISCMAGLQYHAIKNKYHNHSIN